MSRFSFEYPWVLGVLIVFIVCARYCKERREAIFFPHLEAIKIAKRKLFDPKELLKWITLVFALIALASPVSLRHYTPVHKEGRDIVLVIDSSDSMRMRGFDPNNLAKTKFEALQETVEAFIAKRKSDRIGIVNFADFAYIASPLTYEKRFLETIMRMQRLGIAGKRTALNDALVLAYHLLSKSEAKSKIVIVLTDGIDNASRVRDDEVLAMVKENDIKLYAIGMGTPRDFNALYLESLAKAGGGEMFIATDADALERVYAKIDAMEASKIKERKIVHKTYYYHYPLFVAFLALLGYIYLRTRALRWA